LREKKRRIPRNIKHIEGKKRRIPRNIKHILRENIRMIPLKI
jgi:hypothetical protein